MFGLISNYLARSPVISSAWNAFSPKGSFNLMQMAQFSKYISKARAKRLPLTTKRAGKGYYKGNRCRTGGRITSKGTPSPSAQALADPLTPSVLRPDPLCTTGRFHRIPEKCTELIVPDLRGFTLKPYVAVGAKRNLRDVEVKL